MRAVRQWCLAAALAAVAATPMVQAQQATHNDGAMQRQDAGAGPQQLRLQHQYRHRDGSGQGRWQDGARGDDPRGDGPTMRGRPVQGGGYGPERAGGVKGPGGGKGAARQGQGGGGR
jgi:hypothetical protein